MNKFSVKSKGVFLIENVDYGTALAKARTHVEKTTNAAHIIALASNKVQTTVYQAGFFPITEHDAGMRARHYLELGTAEYKAKCEQEQKELDEWTKKWIKP
jgi:hypothetical protein